MLPTSTLLLITGVEISRCHDLRYLRPFGQSLLFDQSNQSLVLLGSPNFAGGHESSWGRLNILYIYWRKINELELFGSLVVNECFV